MEEQRERKLQKEKPKSIDWISLGVSGLSWFLQGAAMAAGGIAVRSAFSAINQEKVGTTTNVVSLRKAAN